MPLASRTFDQLIDFTRTSSATYVNSTGKIVSTPASRNLLLFTQEFDNAAWTKPQATVTANSTTAPDGTSTADTLLDTATSNIHYAHQSIASQSPAGKTYTVSVYAKALTLGYVTVGVSDVSSGTLYAVAVFNLTTGALATSGASGTGYSVVSTSITAVGDGWYRCSATVVVGSSASFAAAVVGLNKTGVIGTVSGGNQSYLGDGSGIFVWGAQLEQASAATTYTRNYGGLFPPRFDYDPVTLAPKGLLIEEQRTNLFTYSEQFDNAAWSKNSATITANATTAPDGTNTADRVQATAPAVVAQDAVVSATSATYTIYAKQGSGATDGSRFLLRNVTTATNLIGILLDYSTGGITYTVGSSGASATNVGNGWWRISLSAATGITSGNQLSCYVGFTGGGSAGQFMFAWGAQLEAGSFATSYIPTVASQVTRSADVAAINAPNFAPWYNQSEGTLFVSATFASITQPGQSGMASLSDGTNGRVNIYRNGTGPLAVGVVSESGGQSASFFPSISTQPINAAIAYKSADINFAVNGTVGSTNTAMTVMPNSLNRLFIGSLNTGSAFIANGYIRSIRYYPTRLSNAQLQALTA